MGRASRAPQWLVLLALAAMFLIVGFSAISLTKTRYNLASIDRTLSELQERKASRSETAARLETLLQKAYSSMVLISPGEQTGNSPATVRLLLEDRNCFTTYGVEIRLVFDRNDALIAHSITRYEIFPWHL